MRTPTVTKRLAVGLVASIGALGAIGFGSYATWTASVVSPANVIAAGNLHIQVASHQSGGPTDTCKDTSGTCNKVWNVGPIGPGDALGLYHFAVTNTGTVSGNGTLQIALNGTDPSSNGLASQVNMQGLETDSGGGYVAGGPQGFLDAFGTANLGAFAAGQTRYFQFEPSVGTGLGNAYQDKSVTFDMTWTLSH